MKDVLLAKVAVSAANFSIDKPYTYQIPETFAQQVTVGMRVLVPFGRGNRHTEGLVLALEQQEALPPRCKRILTALDDWPVLNQEGIQLALWMRERYFCSVYEAMRAMLPAGLYFSLKDRYVIPDGVTPAAAYAAAGQSQRKRQVLDALFAHGRAMERSELYQAMGTASPAAALRELVKGEVLILETSVSRGVGDKTELVVQKATELGVAEIGVFTSRYSSAYMHENKVQRLRKVAREAAKQCLRATVPTVEYYPDLAAALASCGGFPNKLFACEFAQKSDVDLRALCGACALAVGSEGGFSEEEFALARAAGFAGVTLGRRILRAETAAIAFTAVAMFALGELG